MTPPDADAAADGPTTATNAETLGDELQYDGIPQGWRQCPNMGQPMRLPFISPTDGRELKTYLVPMKV